MNATSYGLPGTTGGNREDLRGPLTILEPEETPFISATKKGPAPKSTLVEHGADRLRKPRLTGTREGASGPKGGNNDVTTIFRSTSSAIRNVKRGGRSSSKTCRWD